MRGHEHYTLILGVGDWGGGLNVGEIADYRDDRLLFYKLQRFFFPELAIFAYLPCHLSERIAVGQQGLLLLTTTNYHDLEMVLLLKIL